jgi:3-isopropylmalate/(R)-2-methylmalate dehydratase small subunit
MQPFTLHTGMAVALLQDNLNTDLIIPKQFLKTVHRRGLGRHLFHDLRYREDGSEQPDFPLNQPRARQASILLAGANFGCGSSREHAPWALLDYGIRAVLAPSFADIFATNAVKNGILPAALAVADLAALAAWDGPLAVDLTAQEVRAGGEARPFQVDPWARHLLLEGLDEVEQTLRGIDRVEGFERRRQGDAPWL